MDGAIGGITTRGFMHFSVYSERPPVPRETTHNVLPDGGLGEEIVDKRRSRKGIIRTLEVDVIVNDTTARELRAWLDKKIEELDRIREKLESQKAKSQTEKHNGSSASNR